MSDDPLTRQVGGDHYKGFVIQPVEYIHSNGLDFFQGSVIKYISRYKNKNGRQDLLKARHFIDIMLKLEYDESNIESKENG